MNPKILRPILQMLLLLLGVFALGSWPSWKIYGLAGLHALICGTIVCGAAALVSLVPLMLSKPSTTSSSNLVHLCLLGTLIRLFGTLIGAMVVYKTLAPLKWPFALWLVVNYIVLLIWETTTTARLVQTQNQKPVAQ